MKFLRPFAVVLAAAISIFSFSACAAKGSVLTFAAFNTVVRIETHGTVVSATTKNQLENLFSDLHTTFDKNQNGSFIYNFNNSLSPNQPIAINNDAVALLKAAVFCYDLTNGKFDPTVYPLTKLWGFSPYLYSPNFSLPEQSLIDQAKSACDFSKINFSEQDKTISKSQAQIQMDLGGIAKGYAADKAAKILLDAGHTAGYVSVGGSSLYLLKSQSLGLIHPRKEQNIITCNTENMPNLSLSTSGDYERYHLDKDGKRYSHIIDPDSGYPADTGVMSATVLGIEGAISDGLTTALCLASFTKNDNECELISLINRIENEFPTAAIYVIYQDQTEKLVITNQTQNLHFTLHDNEFSVYNV